MINMPLLTIPETLKALSFSWNDTMISAYDAADKIIAAQGKNKNRLRAAKPMINYEIISRKGRNYRNASLIESATAQIWRYVAFYISPMSAHHSMPVTVSFDSPFDMTPSELNTFTKWCADVADQIVNTIPAEQRYGINRWARALGY